MYHQKTRGWSQHLDFMLFDILVLELSLALTFIIRVGFASMLTRKMFWGLVLFLPLDDLAVMVITDIYHGVIRRNSYKELTKLLRQTSYIALLFGAFLILTQTQAENTSFVFFITLLIYMVLCFLVRCQWKSHLQHRLHIKNHTGLLVISGLSRVHEVVTNLVNHNYDSYRFVGVALLDINLPSSEAEDALKHVMMGKKEVADLKIVAGRDELLSYLVTNWVDEVYLDVPDQMPIELINKIMTMGITVHLALGDIDRIVARHKNIEWICGQATITASLGYVSKRDLLLKRIVDIFGSVVGCILTGILTVFLAPLIYFSSPGPIFFRQARIGENGRRFFMFKFRSMYMDAEKRKRELQCSKGDDLMFKMEHDPRIIGMKQRPNGTWKKGVGGWIRDLSLDEFPQFFNVLKGDMSLVGTRPPTVDEWEKYKPAYRARMSTRPGMTGMWQVSGRSKIRDFDKVVQLDREYIENWSLRLDFQILIRTIWVVLTRRGSM